MRQSIAHFFYLLKNKLGMKGKKLYLCTQMTTKEQGHNKANVIIQTILKFLARIKVCILREQGAHYHFFAKMLGIHENKM